MVFVQNGWPVTIQSALHVVFAGKDNDFRFRGVDIDHPTCVGPIQTSIVGQFNPDQAPDLALALARPEPMKRQWQSGSPTFGSPSLGFFRLGPTSPFDKDVLNCGGVAVLRGSAESDTAFSWDGVWRGTAVSDLAAVDIDGDGIHDIVAVGADSDTLYVLRERGELAGWLEPSERYEVGRDPRSIVVSDLNADGHDDLVVVNAGSDDIAVLLSTGQIFLPPVHFEVGNSPRAACVGDLDGDGVLDVAVANRVSGTVSVLFGVSGGWF
jgi:hypothetical protein